MPLGRGMVIRRKMVYTYLTFARFLGSIAIFIVDGYLGIYNTTYATSGEYERKIEPDFSEFIT